MVNISFVQCFVTIQSYMYVVPTVYVSLSERTINIENHRYFILNIWAPLLKIVYPDIVNYLIRVLYPL